MRVSVSASILDRTRATARCQTVVSFGVLRLTHSHSGTRCSDFQPSQQWTPARPAPRPVNRLQGFSLTELIVVVAILFTLCAFAIPSAVRMVQSYQAASNARSIASTLALAKMDAARNFTQTQLNCNLGANSCQVQVCTNKGATTCNAFSAEGGPILLSQGMNFSFGSISNPAGTQTTIQNTAQIVFNSRGIPVDNTGALTGDDGLYLTSQAGATYAVTVNATGKIAVWQYDSGAWRSL